MANEELQESVARLQNIQAQIKAKKKELERLRKAHLDFWENFQKECAAATRHENRRTESGLGYRCKYCLRYVYGIYTEFNLKVDFFKRDSFTNLLNCDKNKWPSEKRIAFERAKKELDEYFEKAELFEKAIEKLREEEQKIKEPLEAIWKLLDNVLGKDIRRKRKQEKMRNDYEKQISDLEARFPRPYDPDRYYND